MKTITTLLNKNMKCLRISPVISINIKRAWKTSTRRMPSSGMRIARLLTVSQHALHREGGLPGGVCLGGYLPRVVSACGVSVQGGVCLGGVCPEAVCPGGCIPACNGADTLLWTDRLLWKHNLRELILEDSAPLGIPFSLVRKYLLCHLEWTCGQIDRQIDRILYFWRTLVLVLRHFMVFVKYIK